MAYFMRDTRYSVCPLLLIPKRVRRMTFFNKVIEQSEVLYGKIIGRVDLARDGPGDPLAVIPRLLNLDLGPLACQASFSALRAIWVVLGALKCGVSICRVGAETGSVHTLMRLLLQLRQPRRDFVCTLRRRALFIGERLELLADGWVASGDVLEEEVSRG